MFKRLMLLGLINCSIAVPFIFFNRKRAPPTVKNLFTNKTNYINVPVRRYNNSLLITLMLYDLQTYLPKVVTQWPKMYHSTARN